MGVSVWANRQFKRNVELRFYCNTKGMSFSHSVYSVGSKRTPTSVIVLERGFYMYHLIS